MKFSILILIIILTMFTLSNSYHVYTLNLKNGKKYVGYSKNVNKRINDHFRGNGAKWTQKHNPISVANIQKCNGVNNCKKMETKTYYETKSKYGNNVRGAGNTNS